MTINPTETRIASLEARIKALESRLAVFPKHPVAAEGAQTQILRIVANHFGITIEQLTSRCRCDDVAWPRQIAMHLYRNMLHLTCSAVGEAFKRDHGTVLFASKAVVNRISTDRRAAEQYRAVKAAVMNGV